MATLDDKQVRDLIINSMAALMIAVSRTNRLVYAMATDGQSAEKADAIKDSEAAMEQAFEHVDRLIKGLGE